MIELSPDQSRVIGHILEWFEKDKAQMPFITLGGYAGTGKTTVTAYLRKKLYAQNKNLTVSLISYTGKASRVLYKTLRSQKALAKNDTVSTIHALIYSPVVNDREEITGWRKKDSIDCDLIIIDEASMVDEYIWQDLRAYDVPIIAIGDHGQLPPIRGKFNLMEKPDLTLTNIHRQAEKNPIIAVSIEARTAGTIAIKRYSDTVIKYSRTNTDAQELLDDLLVDFNEDMLVLCGYNKTRKQLNYHIRQLLGFESPEPVAGDRVICLRNNHKNGLYNGMLGTIVEIDMKNMAWYEASILMDDEVKPFAGLISASQFGSETALNFTENRKETISGDLFDFGYALTVHKAQGSQAKKVIVFEERFAKMDDDMWRRWLYTAVTRAQEELYVFG